MKGLAPHLWTESGIGTDTQAQTAGWQRRVRRRVVFQSQVVRVTPPDTLSGR
jgi:hypothetical protein